MGSTKLLHAGLALAIFQSSLALAGGCGSDEASPGSSPGGAGGAGGSGTGGTSDGGTGATGGADAGADAQPDAAPDGSGGGTGACVPNETRDCDCTQGVGAIRCAPDGTHWYACECAVYGAEIEVSPDGDDTDTGAPGHPFATLGRARERVRELVANAAPDGGVVVWLMEGVYELHDSLVLGAEDSGRDGAPIVWRSHPGETARISGGHALSPSAFAPVDSSDPIHDRLDATARDHVVQIDLPAAGVTDFGSLSKRGFCHTGSSSPLELFVDGTPMTLARWPDADANDVQSGAETADALDLFGAVSPDVTGHYVKDGAQDGVSSFARDGLVGGLQYHLYRRTWDYQGQTHTAWFLTTQASGYPADTDPWWYRYSTELGNMDPAAGASGIVTSLDPESVNHGFASIAERVSDTAWKYHGSRPSRWNAGDAWFHGFWKYAWADCHVQAASIDTANSTVTFAEPPGYGIEAAQPWYAYNLVEEITEPGEWWLDRQTGRLYLWPPQGSTSPR